MLRPPRTLLWRLCLALITIQVVVAIAFATYAYRSAREYHHQQTVQKLQRLAALLAPIYVTLTDDADLAARSMSQVVSEIHKQARAAGVRITLIDSRAQPGRVITDTHSDAASMDNHLLRPEVQAALADDRGVSTRYSDSVAMDMKYYAQRIGDDNEGIIMRIAVPMTDVNADLRRLLWVFGTAGLALLLMTIVLVYFVSRYFSRTVSRLSEQAVNLASEQEHAPIAEATALELVPLANSLNNLAQRLHNRIRQLQLQQLEHEAILQSMSSGVIALDLQQRIVRLNRAAEALLGTSHEPSHDAPVSDQRRCAGRLLQEVTRSERLNQYVDAVVRDGTNPPVEIRLRRQPELIVQVSSSPLTNERGEREGVLIVLNDVTPLRRLESLRSDFAANVSHELRTPITNIKGYVETLLQVGVEDSQQSRHFLDIIKRNSDRLAAIVEDILSLAWLEQPGTAQALSREVVQVQSVVEAVTAQFQQAAASKRIVLKANMAENLAAPMNRQLVEQALANYVSNAIKYSPADTTVTIGASLAAKGWIDIAVTDEGSGIGSDHLPRIFERFYRVDKARSRELGGTGLGLAIVKHIAFVHGGQVAVDSTLGKGSVFHLRLPA